MISKGKHYAPKTIELINTNWTFFATFKTAVLSHLHVTVYSTDDRREFKFISAG